MSVSIMCGALIAASPAHARVLATAVEAGGTVELPLAWSGVSSGDVVLFADGRVTVLGPVKAAAGPASVSVKVPGNVSPGELTYEVVASDGSVRPMLRGDRGRLFVVRSLPGAPAATKDGRIRVQAASLSPLEAGRTTTIAFQGAGLGSVASARARGALVTVERVVSASATILLVDVRVPIDTTSGSMQLELIAPGGEAVRISGLTIDGADETDARPLEVSGVTPNKLPIGTRSLVTVIGQGVLEAQITSTDPCVKIADRLHAGKTRLLLVDVGADCKPGKAALRFDSGKPAPQGKPGKASKRRKGPIEARLSLFKGTRKGFESVGPGGASAAKAQTVGSRPALRWNPPGGEHASLRVSIVALPPGPASRLDVTTLAADVVFDVAAGAHLAGLPGPEESLGPGGSYAWWVEALDKKGAVTTRSSPLFVRVETPGARRLVVSPSKLHLGAGGKAQVRVAVFEGGAQAEAMVVAAAMPEDRVTVTEQKDGTWQVVAGRKPGPALIVFASDDSIALASVVVRSGGGVTPVGPGAPCGAAEVPSVDVVVPRFQLDAAGAGREAQLQVFEVPRMCLAPEADELWTSKPVFTAAVGGKREVAATRFTPVKGRTYAWGVTWSDADGAPSYSPMWCFNAGPVKASKTRPADVAKGLRLGKQAWKASPGASKSACSGCSVSSAVLAGPSPTLALANIEHAAMTWPRTLPLKAVSEDTDLLDVRCSHCDGSFKQYAIRDGVHPGADDVSGYKWAIASGPGSLNAPWSDAGIVAARSAIDQHTTDVEVAQEELARAEAAIPPLEADVASLQARRKTAAGRVSQLTSDLAAVEAKAANAEERRTIAEALLAAPRGELAATRARAAVIEVAAPLAAPDLTAPRASLRQLLAAQAGIDEDIRVGEARLFALHSHTGRWTNHTRIKALDRQIADAERYRQTRFDITCKKAAAAVPLLLTLSPPSAAGRLEAAHALKTFRTFLGVCDLEVPATLATHLTKTRPLQALCREVAYGVPRPSPTQLEISMACRAVHYAVQSLDAERALRRERGDVANAGTLDDPREEMQALRRELDRLVGDKADIRQKVLQAQEDQRRALLLVPERSRPTQLELRGLLDSEAAAASAVARLELELRLIRAERRRLQGEAAAVDADVRRARRAVRDLDDDIARAAAAVTDAKATRDVATRALAAVEARRGALDEATAEAWESLSPVREATGQLVWYSPPPLEVLLNDAPEARTELDALRLASRKARKRLAALQRHLGGVWSDQLGRLEQLVDLTGEYKALIVERQKLLTHKGRLQRLATEKTEELAKAAAARKKALQELASRLDSMRAPEAIEALSRQREQAKAALAGAVEARGRALTALDQALQTLQESERAFNGAQRAVGDAHRLLLEEVTTMLSHRVAVYEHRLEVKVIASRDRMIENLIGESNRDLIKGSDEDERKSIEARDNELAELIRNEEQAGEDTRKRIVALRAKLIELRAASAASERARDMAVSAYQQAMGPLDLAREAERDAATRIVGTRQSIRDVWQDARGIVMDAIDVVMGERDGAGDAAEALALVGRDAMVQLSEEVNALRTGVIGVPDAYRGDQLVADTSTLSALRTLTNAAGERFGAASTLAAAATSARQALPGTELQRLRDEIVAAEAAIARNTAVRTSLHARIQGSMRAAKAARDRAIGDDLQRAQAAAAAADKAHADGLAAVRKRLVSAVEVKLALKAKDRGSSVGKADDAEVVGTVTLTFDKELRPTVKMPPVASSGAGEVEHLESACLPGRFAAPGPGHSWTSTSSLPATVYADELFSGFAWSRDVDAVSTACTAVSPGCALSGVGNTQLITEEHAHNWTMSDAAGSAGGGGVLIGGGSDGSAVLQAPSPEQVKRGETGTCDKTVLVTVATGAAGDLGIDGAPAPKVVPVTVRAGHVDAPSAGYGKAMVVEGLMGAPVEVSFDVYRLAEAGTPLADNVPFRVPLDGRDVTLRVERIAGDADPEKRATDWGFGGKPETTVKTVGGKARAMLTMSQLPGRYRVTATWRDGDACRASVDVRTPLRLDTRVLYAPTDAGFYTHVLPLIERGAATEQELMRALEQMLKADQGADATEVGDAKAAIGADTSGLRADRVDGALQAWTILSDRDFKPVAGRTVRVSPLERDVRAGKLAANPTKEALADRSSVARTAGLLGLARAELGLDGEGAARDFPSTQRANVKVEVTDPNGARFAASPYPATATFGDATPTRVAWIGPFDPQGTTAAMLRLDLARAAIPGKPYHGVARVTFPAFGGSAAGTRLVLEDAEVGGLVVGPDGQARAGVVRFERLGELPETKGTPPRGCARWPGNNIVCVGGLSVTPGEDARVHGFVDLALRAAADGSVTRSGRLRFETRWNAHDGAVLELVDTLPEIPLTKAGAVAIAAGASAVLDLSVTRSPSGLADTWRGLHVRAAELTLRKLRGGDTSPRVALDGVNWAWPLHTNHPDGGAALAGLDVGLPGFAQSRLTDISVRFRNGVFTVDAAQLLFAVPGAAGAIRGDVTHFGNMWALALSTPARLTFGERIALTLAPGSHGVFNDTGITTLVGSAWVSTALLPPVHFAGWRSDPRASSMKLAAKEMHTPVTLTGWLPSIVQGATFSHETTPGSSGSTKTRLEVAMRLPVAGSGEAPASLTVGLDDEGVARELGVDASLYVAGGSLTGRLVWDAGAFSGAVTTADQDGGGLVDTLGARDVHVVTGQDKDQTTGDRFWWMAGIGWLTPDAPGHRLKRAPVTIEGGYLALGWNHDTPADPAVYGTPILVDGAPQSVGADTHIGDVGGGSTLSGRMAATLTHGDRSELLLDGNLVLFDEEDTSFGHSELRLGRRGSVTGHVDAWLELGKPGGGLMHMPTRLDIAGKDKRVEMGSAAAEALLGEAEVRAWGDMRAVIDAEAHEGEVALTYDATGHAEWDWPYNDSEARLRADVTVSGVMDVAYTAGEDGGAKWKLDNAEVEYFGWFAGTLEMGYTRAHTGWWLVEGDAAACFPTFCMKPVVETDIEIHGFDMTVGVANLEIGDCTAACGLKE